MSCGCGAAVGVGLGVPAHAATRGIGVAVKASDAPGAAVVETVRLYGASYALVIGIDECGFHCAGFDYAIYGI